MFFQLKIIILSLSFAFGSILQLQAQSAQELLDTGQKQWLEANFDSAYALFRAAGKQAKRESNDGAIAQSLFLSGKYLARQMQLEAGKATLDSVVAMQGKVGWDHPAVILSRRELAVLPLYTGEIDTATRQFEALLIDCERLGSEKDSLLAMCLHSFSIAKSVAGSWEESLALAQQALAIRKRIFHPMHITIGYSENSIGAAYSWLDQYENALAHWLKAEQILAHHQGEGHPQLIQIRTNIAIHYEDMGLFWQALAYHRENAVYVENIPLQPALGVLLNLAPTLSSVGDHQAALEVLDQAEGLLDANPSILPEKRAYIYGERSEILRALGKLEKAVEYIDLTISELEHIFGKDNFQLTLEYDRKGHYLLEKGDFEEAKIAFQAGIRLAQLHQEKPSVLLGQNIAGLAKAHWQSGDWQEAIRLYKRSNSIFQQTDAAWRQVENWNQIALIYRVKGKMDQALEAHAEAWSLLFPEIPFQRKPDFGLNIYWDRTDFYDCLIQQGNSLHSAYQQSKKKEDLEAAFAAYRLALAISDSQQTYFDSPASRTFTLASRWQDVELALLVAIESHRKTGDISFLEWAFSLAEGVRAQRLREQLRGRNALHFAGIPDSLVEKERYFQQRLASMEGKLYGGEMDEVEKKKIQSQYLSLKAKYKRFIQYLEQDFPAYHQLKYPSQHADLETIQHLLAQDQMLLNYFWGTKFLFTFQLTQDNLRVSQIRLDSSFKQQVNNWQSFISSPPNAKQSPAIDSIGWDGYKLFLRLVPDLTSRIHQLIILPSGPLGYLPFESLLTAPPTSHIRNWPFVPHTYHCTYSYAAEIWMQQHTAQQATSYVGFAPDFDSKVFAESRGELGNLAYNRSEVEQAAKLLKGRFLLGPQATKSALFELPQEAFILHFATHAIADESNLLNSRLYFSPQPDSTSATGILFAHEIYGLRFESPLCVLSACQTARGSLERGEGIMSLARAFQYSGCERVISTLWQADDRSSAQLGTNFFELLAQGESCVAALGKARQDWIQTADNQHAHPYYWANYIMIGRDTSLHIHKKSNTILYGGIVVLLGLCLVVFLKIRR